MTGDRPSLTTTTVVLSLVVQPNGSYVVYSNGAQVMTGGANGDFSTQMVPTANTDGFQEDPVNVSRNERNSWRTFNGNIGDVFVYKDALSAADRQTIETDMLSKFVAGRGKERRGGGTSQPGRADIHRHGEFRLQTEDVIVDGVSQGIRTS